MLTTDIQILNKTRVKLITTGKKLPAAGQYKKYTLQKAFVRERTVVAERVVRAVEAEWACVGNKG